MRVFLFVGLLIGIACCNASDRIFLKSEKRLLIGAGTHLVMEGESVGEVTDTISKGHTYIYSVKLTQDIDLRANAVIGLSYPLIGDAPNLKILNRGTSSPVRIYDTINIDFHTTKEKELNDNINASDVLRAIADSIDAHGKH